MVAVPLRLSAALFAALPLAGPVIAQTDADFYRAYYLERSTAQIAAEYATAEHVVRAELHDAMQALRRILRDVRVTV